MLNRKIEILGVNIDSLTFDETIEKIKQNIQNGSKINHVVVNAGKYVLMQNDSKLYKSVLECDLINADGQSVVWASKFLNNPLPERVAGIDLMEALVKVAFEMNFKCFFLGAKEEVVSKVVEIYSEIYSRDLIAGYRNGYFNENEEAEIANYISNCQPDILFVAINSPKKEIFLNRYKSIIEVNFIMGVGGSFDVIAGLTKRAPIWMQNAGLEWFYRLIQEPGRMWRRYVIGNAKFIMLIIKQKMGIYNNPYESIKS